MTLQPNLATNLANNLATNLAANPQPLRRTILLVEDEPFVRDATASILLRAGYAVRVADDAADALKMYEECRCDIDLVMTDMVLPGKTGWQLGEELHRQSPHLPVLITSGYDNEEFDIEDPRAHIFFLAKPYGRRALLEKIEKILESAPQARSATQAG
jgi:DNA-binding NtrC family response regulator